MKLCTQQQSSSDRRLEMLLDGLFKSVVIGFELMIITALAVLILDELGLEMPLEVAQVIGLAALFGPSIIWGIRHLDELMAAAQDYD